MKRILLALLIIAALVFLPACEGMSASSSNNDDSTEAYERGFSEGKAAGYSIGFTEGKEEGERIGYEKGYGNCQHHIEDLRIKFFNDGWDAALSSLSDSDIYNKGYRAGYERCLEKQN